MTEHYRVNVTSKSAVILDFEGVNEMFNVLICQVFNQPHECQTTR